MIELIGFSGFFLIGLLGGIGHCVGMCGPFVLYVSSATVEPNKGRMASLKPHLLYNLGRIATYSALGAMAGALGGLVQIGGALVGVQKAAAILAGTGLVLFAVLHLSGGRLLAAMEERASTRRLVTALLKRRPKSPFLLGIGLGLLPCGLLYGAAIGAAGYGDPWKGAASMFLFGLGTAPAMAALALLGNFLAGRRGLLYRASVLLVLGMGLFFVWRGIGI